MRPLYGFNKSWMKHPLHLLLEAAGGMLPLLYWAYRKASMGVLAFAVAIQLLQHANVRSPHGAAAPRVCVGAAAAFTT